MRRSASNGRDTHPRSAFLSETAVPHLSVAIAAADLYEKTHLGPDLPDENNHANKDKVVVVLGGSSSDSSNAIQLARASGYVVYAVASKRTQTTVVHLVQGVSLITRMKTFLKSSWMLSRINTLPAMSSPYVRQTP